MSADTSRRERASRKRLSTPVLVALSVAVLLVVLAVGGTVVSMMGDGNRGSAVASQGGASEDVGPSAHEICTNQVFAIAAHVYDDKGAWGFEENVNGAQDQHFQMAHAKVFVFLSGEVISEGVEVARENARARAAEVCSTTLNDAIRPNYPTDGTYLER